MPQQNYTPRPGQSHGVFRFFDWRNPSLWRRAAQAVFLLINIYIGVAFYLWVRHFETFAPGTPPPRPAGVEGWLPVAGLLDLKYALLTGTIPPFHTAALVLLLAFFVVALLLKKTFCSWLCPVGTLSEMLWRLGAKLFGKNPTPPKWFDIPLRSLKYILLALFLFGAFYTSVKGIEAFMSQPYGIIVDVKMLNFFRFASVTMIVTLAVLALLSMVIKNFWCRYLCPYGALLGLLSLVSPFKIRRDADACIDCGKCAAVCPSHLPVDKIAAVRTPECTGCQSCVAACPARFALQFSAPAKVIPIAPDASLEERQNVFERRWKRRVLSGLAVAVALLVIIGGAIIWAKLTGHWDSPIPNHIYQELIPHARNIAHPM